MSPTVTVTHWDPETATLDAEQDTFSSDYQAVIPRCPECGREVLGYTWPDHPETVTSWVDPPVIHLEPCNDRVTPDAIGIPRRRPRYAPRP